MERTLATVAQVVALLEETKQVFCIWFGPEQYRFQKGVGVERWSLFFLRRVVTNSDPASKLNDMLVHYNKIDVTTLDTKKAVLFFLTNQASIITSLTPALNNDGIFFIAPELLTVMAETHPMLVQRNPAPPELVKLRASPPLLCNPPARCPLSSEISLATFLPNTLSNLPPNTPPNTPSHTPRHRLLLGEEQVLSRLPSLLGDVRFIVNVTKKTCEELPEQITKCHQIHIDDCNAQNIGQYFDQACATIDTYLLTGSVLVHCAMGISRSPTIVIAYLMYKQHQLQQRANLSAALNHVRQARECTNPRFEFVSALHAYENKLNACLVAL